MKHVERSTVIDLALCLLWVGLLAGCWDGKSRPFSIRATNPIDGETLVSLDSPISISFNRMVNVSDYWTNAVQAECEGEAITFSEVEFNNAWTTVTLTPKTQLPEDVDCWVQVAAFVHDSFGHTLGSNVWWEFHTTSLLKALDVSE